MVGGRAGRGWVREGRLLDARFGLGAALYEELPAAAAAEGVTLNDRLHGCAALYHELLAAAGAGGGELLTHKMGGLVVGCECVWFSACV